MRSFFDPAGCAVIGASADPVKPGHQMLRSMLDAGFPPERLFPVNPKESEIAGLPVYPDLSAVPNRVELAVLMVPPRALDSVLADVRARAAGRGDLKALIVTAGGFAELGTPEGRDRQAKLVVAAREAGVRLMGPNCIGVIDMVSHVDTTFLHGVVHRLGPITFVSQSGAVGSWFAQMLSSEAEPVGFNKLISLGNMADVTMDEVLDYLRGDPTTGVVGVYLEGTSEPRPLLQAMAGLAREKPVVVIKTGRSETGSRAATSHTGALAGADKVWDGALRQAGVVRVDRMEEFVDIIQVLASGSPDRRRTAARSATRPLSVFLVTHAGGPGVYTMDLMSGQSGLLAPAVVSPETKTALRTAVPPMSSVCKPEGHIDMTASATAAHHAEVTRLLLGDPGVEAVITLDMPIRFLPEEEVATALAGAWEYRLRGEGSGPASRTAADRWKPVFLPVLMHGKWSEKGRAILQRAGLPALGSPDRAVAALAALARLRQLRRPEEASFALKEGADAPKAISGAASGVASSGVASSGSISPGRLAATLNEAESTRLLAATGVAFITSVLAKTRDEALEAGTKLGYPVVLKLCSRAIPHKVAAGAVRLGLKDSNELGRAYDELAVRAEELLGRGWRQRAGGEGVSGGDGPDGFLIQSMAPKGLEVIVGGLRDRLFGPVVAVGPGGSRVGLDAPLLFRLAPLCRLEAEILAAELLDSMGVPAGDGEGGAAKPATTTGAGATGSAGAVDLDALAAVVLGMSRFLTERPDVEEADLNPVILYPRGALAVDALVRVR